MIQFATLNSLTITLVAPAHLRHSASDLLLDLGLEKAQVEEVLRLLILEMPEFDELDVQRT